MTSGSYAICCISMSPSANMIAFLRLYRSDYLSPSGSQAVACATMASLNAGRAGPPEPPKGEPANGHLRDRVRGKSVTGAHVGSGL